MPVLTTTGRDCKLSFSTALDFKLQNNRSMVNPWSFYHKKVNYVEKDLSITVALSRTCLKSIISSFNFAYAMYRC